MAIIDPSGLFNGVRLSLLSDAARLAWPHFWCASNTLGRMELDPATLRLEIFGKFKKPPTVEKISEWLHEYHTAWLLFVYVAEDGKTWGQWETSERFLPRHKTTADNRTPPPPAAELAAWQKQYVEQRKTLSALNGNNFKILRKSARYIGIGIGVGVGIGKNPPTPLGGAGVCDDVQYAAEPKTEPVAKLPMSGLDAEISRMADRLCERHPKGSTRTTPSEAERQLRKIARRFKGEAMAVLKRIDQNHEAWCGTRDWRKDGGRFAKKLSNWLAPTELRYLDPPGDECDTPLLAGALAGALAGLEGYE